MNQVEQKSHDLAVQYTKDGEGNYDARCEWACNEMAEWCDRRHGWTVDQVTALKMADDFIKEVKKEQGGDLPITMRASLKKAFLRGADAIHTELTGKTLEIPF